MNFMFVRCGCPSLCPKQQNAINGHQQLRGWLKLADDHGFPTISTQQGRQKYTAKLLLHMSSKILYPASLGRNMGRIGFEQQPEILHIFKFAF